MMPAMSERPAESPSETGRVLVIDDDDVILEFVRAALAEKMPGVTVTTYHSRQLGPPAADFDWSAHDLLLLDYDLGDGETGTDWLRRFAGKPGFPHTILLSAERSATMVGNAVRQGAAGYLNKGELSTARLVETVREALSTIASVDSAMPAPATPPTRDAGSESSTGFSTRHTLDTGPGGFTYRFIRLIGRGAMSRVYLAERSEDQLTLVLKILARDVARDPENVQRFAREGELISRVNSPYVVKVYDHGTTNSYGYIAMEFFGRGDLAQVIEQGMSPEDAVIYLHNIACGLEAIHAEGIVHRDLKPGNIMLRGDGSMAIADFGLSKRIGGLDSSLTQTGVILGTPYCMSPEQTAGLDADHRSDLYAAGVMFYEMLMGERPFTGPNLPGLLLAIQRAPIPRLPESMAKYQPVVDRLLAKNPDDRYQTAAGLVSELRALVTP